jgi:type VI secretion system Hcp family effector
MARNFYLELTIAGEKVEGEPVGAPSGRDKDIECLAFSSSVSLSIAAGTTSATGRRRYKGFTIRKLIDAASPQLLQALVENKTVAAVFRLYRADPAGGGEQNYFTIEISEARVSAVNHIISDTFRPDTKDFPDVEEVSFVFDRIKWTENIKGTEYEDSIHGPQT